MTRNDSVSPAPISPARVKSTRWPPTSGVTPRGTGAAVYVRSRWRGSHRSRSATSSRPYTSTSAAYIWPWVRQDVRGLHSGDRSYIGDFSNDATIFALDLIMAIVLLIGRRATAVPRSIKEIVVPLDGRLPTFSSSSADAATSRTRCSGCGSTARPLTGPTPLNYASLFAGAPRDLALAVGPRFTRAVVRNLRWRCVLSCFEVRTGLFAIRCTAAISSCRLPCWLAEADVALVILIPVQIALFAWRANLEEARLSEVSSDYRAPAQKTHGRVLFPGCALWRE